LALIEHPDFDRIQGNGTSHVIIQKMNRLLIGLIFLVTACTQSDRDNLKGFIEYGAQSKNYVRWTREQPITWDLFAADPNGQGIFYNYYGIYFFWTKDSILRFNATVYFDKSKSWVKPKNEWNNDSQTVYDDFPKVLKLKFDYYEYVVRQLRKHLTENSRQLEQEDLRPILESYYDKAEKEWSEIQNELNYDFSESKLAPVRAMIDEKLLEYKQFDSSLNSVFY
jgi:hypothetical protein